MQLLIERCVSYWGGLEVNGLCVDDVLMAYVRLCQQERTSYPSHYNPPFLLIPFHYKIRILWKIYKIGSIGPQVKVWCGMLVSYL